MNLDYGEKTLLELQPHFDLKNQDENHFIKAYLGISDKVYKIFLILAIVVFAYLGWISLSDLFIIPIIVGVECGRVLFDEFRSKFQRFHITDRRVIFERRNLLFQPSFNSVYFKDVQSLARVYYPQEVGSIYLMGVNMGPFKNTEHYPALVAVKDSNNVYKMLSQLVEANKVNTI